MGAISTALSAWTLGHPEEPPRESPPARLEPRRGPRVVVDEGEYADRPIYFHVEDVGGAGMAGGLAGLGLGVPDLRLDGFVLGRAGEPGAVLSLLGGRETGG